MIHADPEAIVWVKTDKKKHEYCRTQSIFTILKNCKYLSRQTRQPDHERANKIII